MVKGFALKNLKIQKQIKLARRKLAHQKKYA